MTAPLKLPSSPDLWNGWLEARTASRLAGARQGVDRLKREGAAVDAGTALGIWNDVNIALSEVFGAGSLFAQVHPDEQIRSQAEEASQQAHKLETDISLDPELFDVLAAIDARDLDPDAARVYRHTMRDFTRAGVDRDDETRKRLRDLNEQEILLSQRFSKLIRDDVRSVRLTTAQLEGMPDDYVQAHPAENGLHTITTDYPDSVPLMSFCRDAGARRAMHIAFLSRAWPDNDEVLEELLRARAEHAGLLGYDDWPSYDAEIKMIGNGPAIGAFIDEISAAARDSGIRDRALLLERLQRDEPSAETIDRADSRYYAELLRREMFGVDSQELRRYFEFSKVRDGLLAVTGRLFGLEYAKVDAPVWHEDVTAYDVQLDGDKIGRIYLDLHPRPGKYKHAAQFDLVRGIAGRTLAEGALVCNFSRGLMDHTDVVTLFHEFGHLVHHIVAGRQSWVRFSGVATEWDFVEAPSQMLEEWAWDADVLATFAHDEGGTPIPADLVAKMRAANEFGKGYLVCTQMFYAATSYQLHRLDLGSGDRVDFDAIIRRIQDSYDLFGFIEGTHFQACFDHLQGYTSAYYTYMWSLVIAKDLFSAFDRSDMFAPGVARRYLDTILASGGSQDAADLIATFLGRRYDTEAFRAWLDDANGSGTPK